MLMLKILRRIKDLKVDFNRYHNPIENKENYLCILGNFYIILFPAIF